MQIDTTEKFIEALEKAIAEIGRENGKVLAAQIKTLIEQTKTGATEKTIMIWEYEDTPYAVKTIVDSTYQVQNDGIIYVVLYPIGYRGKPLELYHKQCRIYEHEVKLPLQKLVAYF